jgi:GNAT superfamily N-acetyltransferase
MGDLVESFRIDDQFHVWSGPANSDIVELIGQMFAGEGEHRSRELLHWQYLEHLSGAEVCIAHTEAGLFEEPAALYAAFPTRFRTSGRVATCYQSFDTLTVKKYRGRGLFTRLAEILYSRLATRGVPLVYGIPNGESFGGFMRNLQWSSLDPFPMMVRPIGLRYLLVRAKIRHPSSQAASVKARFHVREVKQCSPEVSELVARSNHRQKSGVIRDYEYLQWRLRRPGSSYRLLESRDEAGRLAGMLVFCLLPKHGCSVGYIMDHIVDEDRAHHGNQLIRAGIECLKASGADLLLAWVLPEDSANKSFRRQGFINLPSRISPIELHLGYRLFDAGIEKLNRSRLAFSYLDSDTV